MDVRSHPYAKYVTHFNESEIKRTLSQARIKYLFLGNELGGLPDEPAFYDKEGRVLYSEMAKTERFLKGIRQLENVAKSQRVAVMCGEENPLECHRRLLVGRVLLERGVEFHHIRGDGRVQSEEELESEESRRPEKRQLSLFEKPGERPWKSIRSVIPRKRPQSFSGS